MMSKALWSLVQPMAKVRQLLIYQPLAYPVAASNYRRTIVFLSNALLIMIVLHLPRGIR
jgi:hypothetical protein